MVSRVAFERWRDRLKRIVLWSIACGLILVARLLAPGGNVQLTLDMSSRVASTAQVFYDTGSGFRETESRTAPVPASLPGEFITLTFTLPDGFRHLRFDPLTIPGSFVVKNVELHASSGVLRIPPQEIRPLNQIESRIETGTQVQFQTAVAAKDPSLLIDRDLGKELRRLKRRYALHLLLIALPLALLAALLFFLLYRQIVSGSVIGRTLCRLNSTVAALARRLSSPGFIQFDVYAIWFYALCIATFLLAGLANLNGSSSAVFNSAYGHGAKAKIWFGAPRPVRSDEWAYVTPDILNQALRPARFDARDSELGNHFAALTGNVPVRHLSTIFRPQLWPFFLLPVDYAYSFNWQCKALILLTGAFTWILLMTNSTAWAIIGSLWFFFSPFVQWSYSWPSALPEMIGSACFAMVLACFLTVGRDSSALMVAAVALAACCINFGMCAYPPQMLPLAWLAVLFFSAWCVAHHEQIFTRVQVVRRAAAFLTVAVIVGGMGSFVYSELHQAIVAVAHTVYPGRRVFSGGTYPAYALASHFLSWTETENRFPPALANICEASGFLWLAPATLVCILRLRLSHAQKCYWIALWATFVLLLAWLIFPVPARFGALLGLQVTGGSRLFPALGLANVAIVVLCITALRTSATGLLKGWLVFALRACVATAVMLLILHAANKKLEFYFGRGEVLFAALAAGSLIGLLMSGRKSVFALWLLLPQALLFGAVNPVEQGLPVFLSSDLLTFVQQHPDLRRGKWIVFSDSVISSGFLAAMGCDVYTGTRYLPDIDHFALFEANHYDIRNLNRDGYLTAHLRKKDSPARIELPSHVTMQWDVSPSDPILKQMEIRYAAFDGPLPPPSEAGLIPLAPAAVDGFWLYRLR